MNPVRALLVALLALATLAVVPPAAAGGPTSVLLSVPGEGRTASLYYTDPGYEALADLVGVEQLGGSAESDEGIVPRTDGQIVTITWLIHDVTPWRVDQVQLDDEGRPWIATHLSESGDIWESPVTWHRPDDPKRLLGLLGELGVGLDGAPGTRNQSAGGGSGVGTNAAEAPATTTVTTEDPAPAGQEESSVSLPSLGGGLLAGLAGGALLMALWLRRRPSPEAGTSGPDVAGPADRLAWRS